MLKYNGCQNLGKFCKIMKRSRNEKVMKNLLNPSMVNLAVNYGLPSLPFS